MRKPTGPGGTPPAGAAGPEPAVPYDAAEWDRRLVAARERRAKILALRGAGASEGPPPAPVLPVGGLFPATGAPVAAPTPGPDPVTPRPSGPAAPAFEGRMDRIARAMEAARQRSGDADPTPAPAPAGRPGSGPGPASESRPAAEPLRRAVARAPVAARVQLQPEPAVAATGPSRLIPALVLGAVAAIGLAGGAYLMFGRAGDPGTEAVALAEFGTTNVAVGAPQPAVEQTPARPSARVPDSAPGALPGLEVAAIPAPMSLPLARDVPAMPATPADSAGPATVEAEPAPSAPGLPQPVPRPGVAAQTEPGSAPADLAADPDGNPDGGPNGAVALAEPAVAPPPVAPVVPDPAAFRLRVNAPASAQATEVEAVGTTLAGAGFPGVQPQRVGFTVSRTHLRYYNAEDAAVAQAIAARLGVEARDFTGYRPKPAVGTIEVWIAGAAPDGARRTGRAQQPQSDGLPSPAEAAKNIGQAVKTLVETFPANEQR